MHTLNIASSSKFFHMKHNWVPDQAHQQGVPAILVYQTPRLIDITEKVTPTNRYGI